MCPMRSGHLQLVVAQGDVDLCLEDPGFDVVLYVATDIATMARIWLEEMDVRSAVRTGVLAERCGSFAYSPLARFERFRSRSTEDLTCSHSSQYNDGRRDIFSCSSGNECGSPRSLAGGSSCSKKCWARRC